MNIKDYVKKRKAQLDRFETKYLRQKELYKDFYPMTMEVNEWDEQFDILKDVL